MTSKPWRCDRQASPSQRTVNEASRSNEGSPSSCTSQAIQAIRRAAVHSIGSELLQTRSLHPIQTLHLAEKFPSSSARCCSSRWTSRPKLGRGSRSSGTASKMSRETLRPLHAFVNTQGLNCEQALAASKAPHPSPSECSSTTGHIRRYRFIEPLSCVKQERSERLITCFLMGR